MRLLLNYDYRYYPFTTASYIEMAAKARGDIEVFRLGENRIPCADVILNIEPTEFIIHYPGKKNAYWEIDNHISRGTRNEFYEKVDYLFITQKYFQDLFPKEKTTWVPLAADPGIHKPYDDEPQLYDVGFLGNDTYPRRRELLEKIGKYYNLLRSTANPGEEYSRKLSQCKMIFNCSMDNDMNMRFFEALSIERLLLTDYVDGQSDIAQAGRDYVLYKDWEDLNSKIKHYLEYEEERKAIAKCGRELIKAEHTYADRLDQMLGIMGVY